MSSNSPQSRARSKIRLPLPVLVLLGAVTAVTIIWGAVWLFRTVQEMAAASQISDPDFIIPAATDADNAAPDDVFAPSVVEGSLPNIEPDSITRWEGDERITFLFLGVDQRCDEVGPTHSDTLMLFTLNPADLSGGMLSIPRDLWVDIPHFYTDRINQAYYLGEIQEYPGGGEALAMETVQALLGVPIDYYVTVNFDAFVQAVDQIGGIVIDVPEAIDDPTYPDSCYGYEPFKIQAGQQRLDGVAALKYARTRATFGGDVDRAGRQQAVLLAVQEQVFQLNKLPQLIIQAPQLWRNFQENVHTNLSLEESLQLALLVQDVPRDNIRTAVLDYDFVYNETTDDGRQVLVPRRDQIRILRDELFAPAAIPTPTFEDLPKYMVEENARVAVYNGTAVFGLAGDTQTYLQRLNMNISEIGNADSSTYRTTQIIDYGSHPNTTLFLVREMGIPPLNVSSGSEPDGDFDVLVIIGDDWRVP